MKRLMAALLVLALTLAAGCSAGQKEVRPKAAPFTNPVYVGGKDGLHEAADPMAIKYNGEYYTYVTGDPCQVLKSDDLVNWKLIGNMTEAKDNCWAPDVVYKNGVFYAYLSTELASDPEGRRVRLYTSARPEGPFKFQADVTDVYSYDAHYFAGDDGKEYLYWSQNCVINKDALCAGGNGVVVDRLVSMDKLAGEKTRVIDPEGWECKGRCIAEAPSVLKHDGLYYMLYSGAAYENASYANGMARAQVPMGPGRARDESWTKLERVLQTIELKVDGPGGASWVKGPNNLDDWLIYHGRGFTSRETMDRWLRIDPVMWGKDQVWVPGGASYTAQPGPALPQFRDLFPNDGGLSKDWSAKGGKWTVGGGLAGQEEPGATARALVGEPAAEYVFEASLRLVARTEGSAGIYAWYADDQHYATLLVDPVKKALVFAPVGGGEPRQFGLPEGFDPEVFHQLMVSKNGDGLAVSLDGRPLGTVTLPSSQAGKVGLATDRATAQFDGVAFTHGWEDTFATNTATWGLPAANAKGEASPWEAKNGALAAPGGSGRQQVFKGARQWGSFDVTVNIKPNGHKAGLYAGYYDARNNFEVGFNPTESTLMTVANVRGKATGEAVLLKDFDFNAWHTLRVVKSGFQYTVYLDGIQVQQRTVQLGQGQIGLFAEGGGAEFDNVRAVRWD